MSAKSRRKGKRGELEFAKWLRGLGLDARRGRQFSGSQDSPDVVCDSLGLVHIEVKRCESVRLWEWFEQATADAGTNIPVVFHRRNRGPWVAILPAEDLVKFILRTKT